MAAARAQGNGRYDVVVVGGGMAGAFAALGASKHARRVLLVEQNASLGGQGTLTGERQFCGDVTHVNLPFDELLQGLRRHDALGRIDPTRGGTTMDGEVTAFLLQERVLASGVEILFHTCLVDVRHSRGRVDRLLLFNKSGLRWVRCGYAIDCTGEGDLCAMAGFPTMKGGETRTPEGGRKPGVLLQLPMSLCFWIEDVGSPVEPILPPNCPAWRDDDDIPMTTINHISPHIAFVKMKVIGGDSTDGRSYSDAEIRARRQMMGLIYHLQTKGYRGKLYSTFRLRFVSPGLGIREGRRAEGEYVLTEADVRKGRRFSDAVAVGTYQIDYHWPDVLQRAGTGITDIVPPYHIPLRSLMPKGSRNLLVAGRCVSGDQMAMSSFRVMTSCAQTGFAAGLACGLASRRGSDLPGMDVQALQAALGKWGQLLNTTPYRRYRRQRRLVNEMVLPQPAGICDAPTVLELDYGETIAAWSAGTDDAGPGGEVRAAIRAEEEWGPPFRIAGEGDLPLRNPVLFRDGSGPIHLFYHSGPDWAVTRHKQSRDGANWGGRSSLVKGRDSPRGPSRNSPIVLGNGDWLSPSWAPSGMGCLPAVEVSRDGGRTWTRSHVVGPPSGWSHGGDPAQPTLWESEPGTVHMLVTDGRGKVFRSDSVDSGANWGEAYPTSLPRSSGLDLVRLEDGGLVAVYCPVRRIGAASGRRRRIFASLSEDNGQRWSRRYLVQDPASHESLSDLSNPSAAPAPEGLSIVYTVGRAGIGFCRLSVENIKGC
jgi:predicted neuraminidase